MRKFLYVCLWCLSGLAVMMACSGSPANRSAAAAAPADDSPLSLELPLPNVPSTLREPLDRANYIVGHFWDAMDFGDTLRSHNSDFVEQNFANFISVFPYSGDDARRAAVVSLLQKAEADSAAYVLLADVAEKYLYDPNSPMLNEEFYILFLEQFVNSPVLGRYGTIRPRYQLEAARKNRPGMTAADFSYVTRDGRRSTLHKTRTNGDMLVIFYDPDCEHCRETMVLLCENELLNSLVAEKRLTVLAVHSGDMRDLWEKSAASLPAEWIVGYESGAMQESGSYVLRAMPTMYLLDSRKNVILKDVLPAQLFEKLYGEE